MTSEHDGLNCLKTMNALEPLSQIKVETASVFTAGRTAAHMERPHPVGARRGCSRPSHLHLWLSRRPALLPQHPAPPDNSYLSCGTWPPGPPLTSGPACQPSGWTWAH